jgi:hypothetical protein
MTTKVIKTAAPPIAFGERGLFQWVPILTAQFLRAQRASRKYEQLVRLGDDALTRRGLARGDISAEVFRELFADR